MKYAPLNLGRWILWSASALLFVAAPHLFKGGFALTMMTQMGTLIIFALSYNMLLGQGGMLSFGHAVYSGLGAYVTVHVLNQVGSGSFYFPVPLLPLVGGVAGLAFGVLFGYVTTRRAGTTFALISLGIGEMVFAGVLMFPGFFGGEAGISTNRVVGKPFFGLTFGPALQVYYLVAAWCFLSMAAMFALTQTPLGRMANAVRDNPERAEFVGYNTQHVRFLQLVLSSFFAGVSGALSCINFEIVSAENVSAIRSGGVLLATFIGGVPFFFGPILGAIVFVFFVVALSGFTKAWLLYLGLFFVLMVVYAPGGMASLILMQLRVLRAGRWRELAVPYALAALAALVALAGLIGLVEMVYRLSEQGASSVLTALGLSFDARSASPWFAFAVALAVGLGALRLTSRRVGERWGAIQADLQAKAAA
ncbi:MAG: branched-chain amino acid ABC transporter permease [Betaproteobacteria bacterium]|nr:branched-chain amino acid ABC transporter permease [Betaproteobacteria bacterium]MDH5211837.1 branched-chain amino acid ABC transporter permease [Betaproteobacteria bacterium]